ncbi:MAG: hypothetical protein IV104_13005 [Acidovorax sp.]|nr:hypothetical protein [Acidovorax sp.]
MAVTYSTAAKTARMTAVVSIIGTSGKLKLFSAADVLLATFTLAATAGTVSGAVLTLSDANGGADGILSTMASAAGTATKASVTTSGDADVITGLTVGTSGTDLVLDNNVLANGQAITINSATITHAA